MEITLPKKINELTPLTKDFKSIVVVGANGSGKSRFGADIELRYLSKVHRISAQKSLTMPEQVSPTSRDIAENDFLYGHKTYGATNKSGFRWGNKPNTFLLNDYEKLMVLLHTEEYEESITFKENYVAGQSTEKPLTKLDKIQQIWEFVLPHRKIIKKAGKIEVHSSAETAEIYNASEMSDGERVIFYLIGEVVCVPNDTIIIIDEPEMHIHKAVTKHLWDAIELERPDCTFIYLTHDIDFAVSRQDSNKIWMKSFSTSGWDYELIVLNGELPEQLYLEVLGSRQPVLFIEGGSMSIDYQILPLLYPNYNVKSLGSGSKVFEITKSFSDQVSFHHIESFGLIDRDRRTQEEISHINNPNIWVAQVAEIENFLILEDVVKTVALLMMKNPDEVFRSVKQNVITFFKEQLIQQVSEHTISRIERIFNKAISQKGIKNFTDIEASLNTFWGIQNFKNIYDSIEADFTELANTENYEGILKVFNNKGLIVKSNVANLCDLNSKNDAYLNFIIGILKTNNSNAFKIRSAMVNKIQ